MTLLERETAAPDFWADAGRAKGIVQAMAQERAILEPYGELTRTLEEAELFLRMAEAGSTEPEGDQREAVAEARQALDRAERLAQDLRVRSLLSGELDPNNAYLTLHAGAGGTEACDWVSMLFRMYRRYCENRDFAVEILDVIPGEEAGFRRVSFSVTGPYAYGYLQAERGVHRLVRISPFDANRRRHTTFAALDVVAEVPDDINIEIREEDLEVDTFRSGGAGGQHVNKTDSAVRITHRPTGIVVTCQAERSQHKNRAKAMKMLRARLYELQRDERRRSLERFYGEKGEIAWGNQIRSYVLQPYQLVKDHRTGYETGNVTAVLDGDLQPFVEACLRQQAEARREAKANATRGL